MRTIAPAADTVIFGHSHKYLGQVIDGKLWLNPGSCGKRRFGQEISFAVLMIDGGKLSGAEDRFAAGVGVNRFYKCWGWAISLLPFVMESLL